MPRFAVNSKLICLVKCWAVGEELQKDFSAHQGDVLGRIICRIVWIMFTTGSHRSRKTLLASPWSVPLKPQLTEPWQPESQENGEHPQGSSSMVHPHLGWGVCGSGLCISRTEWVREREPKRTKGSASSRGKPRKPGLLTLERRWVWCDHNFLMNLPFKEQKWVWNLVTWKRRSNLLKRKAFVSRKPKASWMVLVVLQSNQDCSSDLLMPCAQEALQMARQCPVFYRSWIFALSLMSQRLIQSVGVQCCWSSYLRRSRDPEISNLKSGLRYFHEPHICFILLANLFWVSFSIMWFAVMSQRKRNYIYALYALYSIF